jgi:hypothetical protein
MRARHFRIAALVVAGALATACKSDSSTGTGSAPSAEATALLSQMIVPTFAGLSAPVAGVPAASVSAVTGAGCTYEGSLQIYVCPTVSTLGGLTVSRSFALLTASGAPQSQFDAATTAAVRTSSSVTGTQTLGGSAIKIDQQQVMTLSGLLTGTRLLNGQSVTKLTSTAVGGTPATQTMTTTITDLVLPASGAFATAWPASGSITMDMQGGSSGIATQTKIVFNGTSKVPVTVTTAGVSTTCIVDLTSPSACTL